MAVSAHQFYTEKRADQSAPTTSTGSAMPPALPKWVKTMPQVYEFTRPLMILLGQLMQVRATGDQKVIDDYFKRVVTELAKIYGFRVRIVQLSDTIPEKDKTTAIDELLKECSEYLTNIAVWLNYGRTST